MTYLYESVECVPAITDEEISLMRRIEPVLKEWEGCMYQRIIGADTIDPRNFSFLWDAKPTGEPFTFDCLNITTIITQHHSAYLFKPSLAEVYAWIRVYMPATWVMVRYFCMGDAFRIGSSTDFACHCTIMGGEMMVRGNSVIMPSGATGFYLKKAGNK